MRWFALVSWLGLLVVTYVVSPFEHLAGLSPFLSWLVFVGAITQASLCVVACIELAARSESGLLLPKGERFAVLAPDRRGPIVRLGRDELYSLLGSLYVLWAVDLWLLPEPTWLHLGGLGPVGLFLMPVLHRRIMAYWDARKERECERLLGAAC